MWVVGHRWQYRQIASTCYLWSQKGESGGLDLYCAGKSRGGMSVKIHAAVNSAGKPVRILFTPGQQNDITVAEELVVGSPESVAADKAYDSDAFIQRLKDEGIKAVIPPKSKRKIQREYDKDQYRQRHKVENYFCNIKGFRRIATRYDHTIASYSGFVFLASILYWL